MANSDKPKNNEVNQKRGNKKNKKKRGMINLTNHYFPFLFCQQLFDLH